MGVERVLQAARRLTTSVVAVVLAAGPGSVAVAAPARERVAVIDLGPADAAVRQQLAAAVVAGGLAPVSGDGIDAALAGETTDPDAVQLAAVLAEAQRAFGALDCPAAITASTTAIGISAARQAAGLAVPELPRAWTYVLLCADRAGDTDRAMHAATRLRALGPASAGDVPRDVWAKYPEVDTMLDREMIPIEITAEVAGAEIWIDFERAGTSPLKTVLPAGTHVIAAAAGTRRGWASGTPVRAQPAVKIPMPEQRGRYMALAGRIAGWRGALPAPAELAAVLGEVDARVAIVRRGPRLEAWGRAGRSEAPYRLGGEDGIGDLTEAPRLVALIADRVQTWTDRAPDPDRPLLVEDPRDRRRGPARADEPTRWWVYAAIAGAVAASVGVVYVLDASPNTQRVELTYP